MSTHHDNHAIWGTFSGTVLTILSSISSMDVIKTVVLAIIGASVSFSVSLFWKWVWRFFKEPKEN